MPKPMPSQAMLVEQYEDRVQYPSLYKPCLVQVSPKRWAVGRYDRGSNERCNDFARIRVVTDSSIFSAAMNAVAILLGNDEEANAPKPE